MVDDYEDVRDAVDDDDWFEAMHVSKVLHIIDIQSGDILQRVRFRLPGTPSTLLVDGDEIYIASIQADKIIVLGLAGSEA